jgi:hypothetical protein
MIQQVGDAGDRERAMRSSAIIWRGLPDDRSSWAVPSSCANS